MPQLGESVAEGTVTQWHVKEGDYVSREQTLLEVATDKADSEVPSPSNGLIVSLHAAEGDILPTGGLLCRIDDQATTPGDADLPVVVLQERDASAAATTQASLSSPSTRRLAREQGVGLGNVTGTGERGRITHSDVARAARPSSGGSAGSPPPLPRMGPPPLPVSAARAPSSQQGLDPMAPSQHPHSRPLSSQSPSSQAPSSATPMSSAATSLSQLMNSSTMPIAGVGYRSYKVPPYRERPGDQVVPFSRRRRITADHMTYSQAVSPHVVTVAEIDLYRVAALRAEHKAAFKAEGVPLTYLTFVIAAVVGALRDFPSLNARVLDDSYVLLKDINVGIAVDTPTGLLVASIKNADRLSMRGIAASVHDLAGRARAGKITADDLMGTTFTVSNPGRKGNLFGGAIISQPNVAILRIGEIKKRPVVVTHNGDDHIAIHPMMFAALSYAHRIVDGVKANSFLWTISDILNRSDIQVS